MTPTLSPVTCKVVGPAFGCDLWEMLGLGILFYISAALSGYCLLVYFRKSSHKFTDQTIWFWFFLMIFQLFRGTITIAPIEYDYTLIKILFLGAHHILLFIPMSLVILILFELLFSYQNPGTNAIKFFRYLFILFILTFTALVIALILIDDNSDTDTEGEEPVRSLSLWVGCTDFILLIFFVVPASSLIKQVTYPIVQPEDRSCVNFCKFGVGVNTVVFLFRMVYNILTFFEANPVENWSNRMNRGVATPVAAVRVWNFFGNLLFDFVPCVLSMIAVRLFKEHDMLFEENPYYTREGND